MVCEKCGMKTNVRRIKETLLDRRGVEADVSGDWLQMTEEDLELHEETALAMAQATISMAMQWSSLSASAITQAAWPHWKKRLQRRRALAERLRGENDRLTIKEMARLCAAAGFEIHYSLVPLPCAAAPAIPGEGPTNAR